LSARLAILGLLVEGPRHGYAIDRLIEERGMRRWAGIGFSSIYWVLDQLVAEGLAEVAAETTSGRTRRIMAISAAGRRAWHDACIAALAALEHSDEEFLVALSGLPGLDPDRVREALDARLAALDGELAGMDEAEARAGDTAPPHVAAMFTFGQALLLAQRAWLIDFMAGPAAPRPTEHQRRRAS
jgi:DNA-binding PadR family transcriptional regulator